MFVFANILQPLIDFFEAFLLFFHNTAGLGWGLSIVALTIVIRAALLPLTLKQTRSMYRLAEYAPQLKELQTKYKDDPQRQQREVMAFYRENKVNPAASCLPALAQVPVFLALFYMLQADLRRDICPDVNPVGQESRPCGPGGAAEFLFIPDLTDKATGTVLVTLIVLYVASQIFSFLLSASPTMDKTQKYIFLALPLVFVAFIWNFPAGLLVYWITTNLWTIVQGVIVRKRLGHLRPPPPPPGSNPLSDLFSGGKRDTTAAPTPARAGAVAVGGGPSAGAAAVPSRPPAPPRRKKKRSGRRR